MTCQVTPDMTLDPAELGKRLFKYVYSEVSAAVYLDEQGMVIDLRLFDTTFGQPAVQAVAPASATRAILYSVRPEGRLQPRDIDNFNWDMLKYHSDLPVTAYWVCEDKCVPLKRAC